MPYTPFHLGPALFIGLLLFPILDLPTFIIANVIVDIEPFLVIFFQLDYPLHGYIHSYLGGTIIAVILAVVMFLIKDYMQVVMNIFKLYQKSSFKQILFTSLLVVYLHISLDSPLYLDIKPFWPLDFNPLYRTGSGFEIYSLCVISFLIAFILYAYKLIKMRKT